MASKQLDVAALYAALDSKRKLADLSWREVAQQTALSPSLFTRMAQGRRPDADAFLVLCQWLGLSPDRFRVAGALAPPTGEDTVAVISSYLRADRALKPRSAEAIERMLQAAYEEMRDPNSELHITKP
jgi:transcriptional regulator with XRE-family HTH domain